VGRLLERGGGNTVVVPIAMTVPEAAGFRSPVFTSVSVCSPAPAAATSSSTSNRSVGA